VAKLKVQTGKDIDRKPAVIAGRYRMEKRLGKGGMGSVYRVFDETAHKHLALKLLSRKASTSRTHSVLFEREYHTLAQLTHPRIIEVFDYGVDESTRIPYYTMELLDGADLKHLAPLEWKEACRLLRDIASSLSLLHSRRLLHRDVSARNVRCTADGRAKLIDFGAMVPFGTPPKLIGTAPFVSPETYHLQSLDQRADLYSLGALAYWLIAGRHAYRARELAQLPDAWRSRPKTLSELVPEVPKALNDLVMSLLSLDRMARPFCAAEVMERLAAIANLRLDEQMLVLQSYLSTPVLVGRVEQMLLIRKQIVRTRANQGSVIVVESQSGMGKSRLLDACVLEGKLLGATVLRADASNAHSGTWGVVRAMCRQLIDTLPNEALEEAKPHLSVLGHILPSLLRKEEIEEAVSYQSLPCLASIPCSASVSGSEFVSSSDCVSSSEMTGTDEEASKQTDQKEPAFSKQLRIVRRIPSTSDSPTRADVQLERFDTPQELRPKVQTALRDWLLAVSRKRLLVLAVDDLHRIDEPSAAFLALLGNEVNQRALMIAVTTDSDASDSAAATSIKLIKQVGVTVELPPLKLQNTEALLISVFGDVPNVRLLANRLHKVSQGSPSAIMKIAQHLADRGLVRYQSGAWTLPGHIDTGDLPESLSDALKARLSNISSEARSLAEALALNPELSVSFNECILISGIRDRAHLVRTINELIEYEIVTTGGRRYALSQKGWVSALNEGVSEERRQSQHLRLAEMFIARGKQACRVAKHLFGAGQDERGLDVLLKEAEKDKLKIDENPEAYADLVVSLPPDWREIYEYALEVCLRLGRPKKQAFLIRVFITRISNHSGTGNKSHIHEIIEQLVQDSGLKAYYELQDLDNKKNQILRALESTQERYNRCPESERVLSPAEAIAEFGKTVTCVLGVVASSYDYDLLDSMPSLEPLAPLSPALDIINKSISYNKSIYGGFKERMIRGYREILERIGQPDRGGLDDTVHRHISLGLRYGLGFVEASLGIASCLDWADEIEKDPLHEVNAWRIRMAYHLRQGDVEKAERCKKTIEMLQIRNSPSQFYDAGHLYPSLTVYVSVEDLVRVKEVTDDIRAVAEHFPTWVPILHYARAEFQRIRGDYAAATEEYEKALSLMRPGRHLAWVHVIGGYLSSLYQLGRYQDAQAIGEQALSEAERLGIEIEVAQIKNPLAIVLATLGYTDEATRHCDTVIDTYRALNSTGINLGIAYEMRARVAVLMDDQENFQTYSQFCAEQYRTGHNPVLTARYERFLQFAREAGMKTPKELENAAQFTTLRQADDDVVLDVRKRLACCKREDDLFRKALGLMVEHTKSRWGYLYLFEQNQLRLVAQSTDVEPPPELLHDLSTIIERCYGEESETQTEQSEMPTRPTFLQGNFSPENSLEPILLSREIDGTFTVVGVAVVSRKHDTPFQANYGVYDAVAGSLLERV